MNTQLKHVISRLSQTNHLPIDIDKKILKLLQTSSNTDFNTAFGTLQNLISLGVTKTPLWSESLAKAELLYTQECTKGNWIMDVASDANSAFKASKITCYICCEDDHIAPNCPHKSNEHKKKSDDLSLRPSKTNGDTLQMNGEKKCWTRNVKGEVQKWCGKCKLGGDKLGCWTTNNRHHFTFEHSGGTEAPHHANLCKVGSDPTTQSSGSDSSASTGSPAASGAATTTGEKFFHSFFLCRYRARKTRMTRADATRVAAFCG